MKNGYRRYCDRCGVELTEENNKCGYEICDKCNQELEKECGRNDEALNMIPMNVIEDIKAEIEEFEEEVFHRPNTDYDAYASVRHCLEIIDKHISGLAESEGKA